MNENKEEIIYELSEIENDIEIAEYEITKAMGQLDDTASSLRRLQKMVDKALKMIEKLINEKEDSV